MGVRDPGLERLTVLLGASARKSYASAAVANGTAAGVQRPVLTNARNVLLPRPFPRQSDSRFGYRRKLSE